MSLFECEMCHHVENTALSNFWTRDLDGLMRLCSECDPAIQKWHGEFAKVHVKNWDPSTPGAEIRYPARTDRKA